MLKSIQFSVSALTVLLFAVLAFVSPLLVSAQWDEASSTALINTTIASLSSALFNILVIIIPVAVAVGIFFFAYNWVRGIFRNRR